MRRPQRHIHRLRPRQNRVPRVILIKGENTTTLSPGLHAIIIATIIASIPPQVTTRFRSGSTDCPLNLVIFRARASRKRGAPHVIAY